MIWIVDTCVIIDILCGDANFAVASAKALDAKRNSGMAIAPVTYVELAPSFGGNADDQDAVLRDLGIDIDFGENRASIRLAHKAWFEHILRKRSGMAGKRPVADVLIGAYAMQKGGLVTRNEKDFRILFPKLEIFNPLTEP